jgi:hypothetical protein
VTMTTMAEIVKIAIDLCADIDDPSMISDSTVHKVWERVNIQPPIEQQMATSISR